MAQPTPSAEDRFLAHPARIGPMSKVTFGSRFAVDTVFEGKRKISPTTRTRTVLIPDIMMLEREAAFKPAR